MNLFILPALFLSGCWDPKESESGKTADTTTATKAISVCTSPFGRNIDLSATANVGHEDIAAAVLQSIPKAVNQKMTTVDFCQGFGNGDIRTAIVRFQDSFSGWAPDFLETGRLIETGDGPNPLVALLEFNKEDTGSEVEERKWMGVINHLLGKSMENDPLNEEQKDAVRAEVRAFAEEQGLEITSLEHGLEIQAMIDERCDPSNFFNLRTSDSPSEDEMANFLPYLQDAFENSNDRFEIRRDMIERSDSWDDWESQREPSVDEMTGMTNMAVGVTKRMALDIWDFSDEATEIKMKSLCFTQ